MVAGIWSLVDGNRSSGCQRPATSDQLPAILSPNSIYLHPAMHTLAVFNPQLPHPKPPALYHHFAAAMAKGIFTGITGDIAGVYLS